MAGNPREHVKDQGFWDGGGPGHSSNEQSSGRPSGFPGRRAGKRVGTRIDLDVPPADPAKKQEPKT